MHYWRQRKELCPVAQQKIDRLFACRDDHVRDILRILCAQERHQGAMVSLGIEVRNVEKLIVHHGARIRFRERLPNADVVFDRRRQQPISGVNDQNVSDFSGRNRRRTQRREANEDAGNYDLPHE
jgi:hypothetical protein